MAASEDFRKSGLLSTVTSRSISACGEFPIGVEKKASLTRSCVLKTTSGIECSFGSAIFSWDILFIIKEEFGA